MTNLAVIGDVFEDQSVLQHKTYVKCFAEHCFFGIALVFTV